MHYSFEYITALQYREKSLSRQVDEFRSGKKYVQMEEDHQKELQEKDRVINGLKKELEQARKDIVMIRKYWEEVQDDVDKEHAREIRRLLKRLEQMEKHALKAEQERDEIKDKYRQKNLELYAVQTELEDERGKNQKLTAHLNKDFENECNVSHDKIRTFISEITDGKIRISKGMINGLCQEFASKTEKEQKEIYKRLSTSPVMNADFTNANVNRESTQVLILASPLVDAAMFIARETKGHKGIKDTPLEEYAGIIVHDHDTTFYSYGTGHQECAQHNYRYLIGSIENEPDRTWNTCEQ